MHFRARLKVKGQIMHFPCTCNAREARDARVFIFRTVLGLKSRVIGKFGFIRFHDVVLAALQFGFIIFMSSGSGENIERSRGADGIISETGDSKYHNVSEDCFRSGGGASECGASIGDTVFFRGSEGALGEKDLRNKSERVPESELVSMVDHLFLSTSGELPETDPGGRAHQWAVSDFCPSPIAVRIDGEQRKRRKTVTFNPEVTMHLIPYEDRASEWTQSPFSEANSFI